jgi:hypothetical protein
VRGAERFYVLGSRGCSSLSLKKAQARASHVWTRPLGAVVIVSGRFAGGDPVGG